MKQKKNPGPLRDTLDSLISLLKVNIYQLFKKYAEICFNAHYSADILNIKNTTYV